jgi:hypothetical protein
MPSRIVPRIATRTRPGDTVAEMIASVNTKSSNRRLFVDAVASRTSTRRSSPNS